MMEQFELETISCIAYLQKIDQEMRLTFTYYEHTHMYNSLKN